jgi:hypothetical protein
LPETQTKEAPERKHEKEIKGKCDAEEKLPFNLRGKNKCHTKIDRK